MSIEAAAAGNSLSPTLLPDPITTTVPENNPLAERGEGGVCGWKKGSVSHHFDQFKRPTLVAKGRFGPAGANNHHHSNEANDKENGKGDVVA